MKVSASEVARRLDAFTTAARESGIKLTHQRLEIFGEIAASLEHPDAEAVFRAVRERVPTVSLDTVYRTLWMLVDLGLVTTLGPRRESIRFDANLTPHHHFVCLRCGRTMDFEGPELSALPLPPTVRRLGSVVDTHVEVRGICENCATEPIQRRQPPSPPGPGDPP